MTRCTDPCAVHVFIVMLAAVRGGKMEIIFNLKILYEIRSAKSDILGYLSSRV